MRGGKKMKGGCESSSENHSRSQEQSSVVHPWLPSSRRTESRFDEILKAEKKKTLKPVYRFNYRERGKSGTEREKDRESDAFLKEWRKTESCTIIDTAAINSIWPWRGVIEKECRRAKKMSLT